jgi:hypothetical protein
MSKDERWNVVFEQKGGFRTWRSYSSRWAFREEPQSSKVVAEGVPDGICVCLCRGVSMETLLAKAFALANEKTKATDDASRLALQAQLVNVLLIIQHVLN